jgi:hypothetical protein
MYKVEVSPCLKNKKTNEKLAMTVISGWSRIWRRQFNLKRVLIFDPLSDFKAQDDDTDITHSYVPKSEKHCLSRL